jgi:hypothetical protein
MKHLFLFGRCEHLSQAAEEVLFQALNKILIPAWVDIVDPGIGLSYRPASLCRLADRYDSPMTLSPQSGTMHLAPDVFLHRPNYSECLSYLGLISESPRVRKLAVGFFKIEQVLKMCRIIIII